MADSQRGRLRILIFTEWYAPGYRAGGPIRSVVNLVDALGDHLDIWIFTSDRDFGSDRSYPAIPVNEWIKTDKQVHLFYADSDHQHPRRILPVIREVGPDLLYLNSMFSKVFTLLPLWLKYRRKIDAAIILAPRGMLKASALQFKSLKKRLFLALFRLLGWHKLVGYHVTDQEEFQATQKLFGAGSAIRQLPNFPISVGAYPAKPVNKPYTFTFAGRIHPIKGLLLFLEHLEKVSSVIKVQIIGAPEDADYWTRCRAAIKRLPANITVDIQGPLVHHLLLERLKISHFLVLPTHGENFGHVIFESLAMGCPVIISDQTPWKKLEPLHAGWDIPLEDSRRWVQQLETAAGLPLDTYRKWSEGAWAFARSYSKQRNLIADYLDFFNENRSKPV